MDSEKYIEQLLDHDDSTYLDHQQERRQQLSDATRFSAIESQSMNQTASNIQNFSNFGNFGQMNSPMRPLQILFCCACQQQILQEGSYTRILNSYTNEEVCIHFQCYEQLNVKGQAGIQTLFQSMIPKFSLSFSIPNHQTKQQLLGQDVGVEIRFINPNTMNIINSFMNVYIPPLFDAANGTWFCQQSLFSQFSISTSVILIDLTLAIPGLHGKKARGIINLFEILAIQSTPITCLQIPVSSRNSMYHQTNMTDIFFLSFNVQLQKDEYLLSNLQFQLEFKDSSLFQLQQPQVMMQNPNPHQQMQMQYAPQMQMGMQGLIDPRTGAPSQVNQQIYHQHLMQPNIHHSLNHNYSHIQSQSQVISNQQPIQQVFIQSHQQLQQLPQTQAQAFSIDLNNLDIALNHLNIDCFGQNQPGRFSSKKKKQALLGSQKFKSEKQQSGSTIQIQSAQLCHSNFKAQSNPFYPQVGQQITDNLSAYSDTSSTMSGSQNLQEKQVTNQQPLTYQRPLQFNSQEYKTQGLDVIKPNSQNKRMMIRGELGLSPNQINPLMTPIDSQSEQTLSSAGKSGNSKRKKGSNKMMMFQEQNLKMNCTSNDKSSSHVGSFISSQTDKSAKSKADNVSSQQDQEIPHLNDMYEYLISQKGSRHLQNFIKKEASYEQISKIIDRIKNNLGMLMIDKYGNYFCQNLLRTVSTENRLKIITFLSHEFVQVSCHDVGTHSMQRLLEIITLPEEKEVIFNAIYPDIEKMALHKKGNYVLTLAFQVLDQPQIEIIVERLLPHFYNLCLDKQGICIANKMITQTKCPEFISQITEILSDKLVQIIQDPFGNYAITTALQTWDNETICCDILKKFKENFVQLAIQNFSQQVLEKCVERANQQLISDFFEILKRENVMKSMIKNQHSIFIVQKIYHRLTESEDQEILKSLIEKNLCYVSDKMIKSRCLSILQEASAKISVKDTSSPNSNNSDGGVALQGSNSGNGSPQTILPK